MIKLCISLPLKLIFKKIPTVLFCYLNIFFIIIIMRISSGFFSLCFPDQTSKLLKCPQSEMNTLFPPCCDPKNTHKAGLFFLFHLFFGALCLEGMNRGRMLLSLRCLGGNAQDCSITSCVLKYHPASLLFANDAGDPAGHSEPSRALGMLLMGLLQLNCLSGRILFRVLFVWYNVNVLFS